MKKVLWIGALSFLMLIGCQEKKQSEWIYLFDGSSLEGWRAYNGASLPSDWSIEEGSLTFNKEAKNEANYERGKNIIYALEEFENFELRKLFDAWNLVKKIFGSDHSVALLKVVENRFFRIFKLKILTKSKMFIFFRNAYSLFRVERKILLQIDISNFIYPNDHVV